MFLSSYTIHHSFKQKYQLKLLEIVSFRYNYFDYIYQSLQKVVHKMRLIIQKVVRKNVFYGKIMLKEMGHVQICNK